MINNLKSNKDKTQVIVIVRLYFISIYKHTYIRLIL
jgi:hypothetical protein